MIKPIETKYKGYRFRSRLEARWAVFFDACGVEWEYEPEGFDLGDGVKYLPDFRFHNVVGKKNSIIETLYVEVKGDLTEEDRAKVTRFVDSGKETPGDYFEKTDTPLLVVGQIPKVMGRFISRMEDTADEILFSFGTIDGDWACPAIPVINKQKQFCLYAAYSFEESVDNISWPWTTEAYRVAQKARFEHGESPKITKVTAGEPGAKGEGDNE